MKRLAFLAAVACLCAGALPGTGRAGFIVDFTYSGAGGFHTTTGSGSFSFANGLTTVGLSDLTAFSFTQTEVLGGKSGTFDYGLSDLTSFSATLGPGPTVTALSLASDFVAQSSGGLLLIDESLSFTGLGTNEALILGNKPGVGIITASTGTVTITSPTTATPEPASLTLLGMGAAGLLGYGWRRRQRAV
jgi:hypothetical protein